MDPESLIANVLCWSRNDQRVVALGLLGSYARGDQAPDSDIDICVLTPRPRSLLEDPSWIYRLGSGARIAEPVEDYNLVQSIRVFYGETEVELGVTDQAWAEAPMDAGTAGVINDGLRTLYDPDGLLESARGLAAAFKTSGGGD
ncbi:MAG: nucleotidyltransferase domain-containing protein [Woeseiaceae bacterium]|nr:nucleotidyltransferase domain-containing protein [Woeseiaceae bacterium]